VRSYIPYYNGVAVALRDRLRFTIDYEGATHGGSFSPHIVYRYSIGGKEYENDRYFLSVTDGVTSLPRRRLRPGSEWEARFKAAIAFYVSGAA
jgi:hypothetical protein